VQEQELKEEDKTLVNDPGISDLDYLKARTVKNVDKLFDDEGRKFRGNFIEMCRRGRG
jgi:hypothetical protein